MPISREVVEHVARLAHVGLESAEVEEMTAQLSSILGHVARLQEVDTSDVPPTAQIVPMENAIREDVVRPSMAVDDVLRNAPNRYDDFFEVQAIFD